jgi:TM2 domain-containing membrane protein YozV
MQGPSTPPIPPSDGGYPPTGGPQIAPADNKKLAAGLCGILLGAFGVHKFILGYNTEGIIMLAATFLTCGFGAALTSIIGLVEGIIYLTKTDQEFYQMYVANKKPWF